MAQSALDPVRIPPKVWRSETTRDILQDRDAAGLFLLARKYGVSQTRLAAATGMSQGRVSEIMNGHRGIAGMDVWDRIALGMNMPNSARTSLGLAPLPDDVVVSSGYRGPSAPSHDPEEAFAEAADETASEASLDCATVSDALAMLHGRVRTAAWNYENLRPMAEFEELKHLKQAARDAGQRAKRPQDRADLFVITGETNALTASLAFDLGYWDSAALLAKAATMYANEAGHAGLEAWNLGLQGTLAFWDDRPLDALAYVEKGLAIAPSAAGRFRLHNIAARAYAVAGDSGGISRALHLADVEREAMDGADELHDGVGGEFTFEGARASACAAAAWLANRNGEQAEIYLQRTLDHYATRHDRGSGRGPEAGSRIDLASARLLQGDRDGAAEAMAPILVVPKHLRTVSLSGRFTTVRDLLQSERWARDPSAADLADQVNDWLVSARSPEATR
jgi:transcriptional regulator with XRE-family HTH domain